jgi:hypothetical protein
MVNLVTVGNRRTYLINSVDSAFRPPGALGST